MQRGAYFFINNVTMHVQLEMGRCFMDLDLSLFYRIFQTKFLPSFFLDVLLSTRHIGPCDI